MSETTVAVSAPGLPGATVIETGINDGAAAPAPTGPAFVSPTDGMSTSQAAAMRWVDTNRSALARDPNNIYLVRQNRAALDHALRGGPPPDWLPADASQGAKADAKPSAAKVDPDSSGFAHVADEMRPEELAHYRTAGVNLGLHPAVSETMAHLAGEYKIPRAAANDLQTVAVQHLGGADAFDSIPVLDDAQQAEMYAAAVEKYGEDVITDLSAQARQVLADKGLLEHFDNLGLTKSSMAFDRRALRALIFWGKASEAK
jgi:hypothetical protein